MQSGVSAAAALEQAARRLEAALDQREAAYRQLSDQQGAAAAELKALRDELQTARDEAGMLRERASLVDALREELAQIQNERGEGDMRPVSPEAAAQSGDGAEAEIDRLRQAVAVRDSDIVALKGECESLRGQMASMQAAREMLTRVAANGGPGAAGDAAALKAELAAARASQAEMQAFQSGIAARLEATMARLRQALDAEAAR